MIPSRSDTRGGGRGCLADRVCSLGGCGSFIFVSWAVFQRTSLEHSVLNDVWVSVPVGSEGGGSDVSFKHVRKNAHEDLLFKVTPRR